MQRVLLSWAPLDIEQAKTQQQNRECILTDRQHRQYLQRRMLLLNTENENNDEQININTGLDSKLRFEYRKYWSGEKQQTVSRSANSILWGFSEWVMIPMQETNMIANSFRTPRVCFGRPPSFALTTDCAIELIDGAAEWYEWNERREWCCIAQITMPLSSVCIPIRAYRIQQAPVPPLNIFFFFGKSHQKIIEQTNRESNSLDTAIRLI